MKISGLTNALNYPQLVREKQDGQSPQQQRQNPEQNQQHQSEHQDDGNAPSNQEMEQAIQEFQQDPQSQASGLNATLVGQGPGLTVVLKDGNGGVIRQLSGEEFLRLRQASSNQGSNVTKIRGKILDQKL